MNVNNANQVEVILFLSNQLSIPVKKIKLEQSLFHDLGVDGDDAIELLQAYASKFNISIQEINFEEYFGPEAGASPFAFVVELLFKNHYKNMKRLTVEDLVKGVNSGKLIS